MIRTDEPAVVTRTRAARLAAGAVAALGVALLGGAAVALWASQGAGVFLESAFAAVIACF